MGFGLIQQETDGKVEKMKSRSGDTVKLMDLIDEAKNRALESFKQRVKENE